MYIHFVVRGEEVEMAKGTREALALTKSPLVSTPSGPEAKPELAKEIERIIGYEGGMFSTSPCPATMYTKMITDTHSSPFFDRPVWAAA